VGSLVLVAEAQAPPPQPTAWQRRPSETRELIVQVPTSWQFFTCGSAGSFERVVIKTGKFTAVTIDGSQVMGTMGDVSSAAARAGAEALGDLPLKKRAEGRLHETLCAVEKEKDPHYQEAGEMRACTFAGMPAAYSEYTTTRRVGAFTVKLKGRRLTCPAGDYSYDVRAVCPEKQWDEFEPIATRILAGVTRGGGDG